MAHLDIDTVLAWRGRTVRGAGGERIGTFGDVFLDRGTDLPAWGGVRTGFFGRHESYVPLAAVQEQGDGIAVPYTADQVKEAPRIDPDVALTAEEEQRMYAHYGQEYARIGDEPVPEGTGLDRPLREGEMVRSEEVVRVHEGPMRPVERVRLRKVLVTHYEERTIPVRKEVVQLETDPPPAGHIEAVEDAGEAPDAPGR